MFSGVPMLIFRRERCEDQPVKHLVLWLGRAGRMLRMTDKSLKMDGRI